MCGIISMKGGANMNHLKELRAQKGYTQSELGKMLGVSASTIGMYEQGRREPDKKMLRKISRLFTVSIDYLLGNTPSETGEPLTHSPEDANILKKYRQLSRAAQDQLNNYLDFLLAQETRAATKCKKAM